MFGKRIRDLREVKGKMTQAELAERLGVTQQAVGRWEKETNRPDYNALSKIADLFGVSVDYLVGREKTNSYYDDVEVAKIAQQIHDNPNIRVMFDASRKLSKERLEQTLEFIQFQLSKEGKS